MSTEERIRDIRRQGMTEYEATEDRKRQIAEMQEQARRALANGELELARQLAQKAMDMAAQVATSQTNEAKRQLPMSTEERVRDIRRQGMTEYEATEDRKRQIAEYQTKAREQLANGENQAPARCA